MNTAQETPFAQKRLKNLLSITRNIYTRELSRVQKKFKRAEKVNWTCKEYDEWFASRNKILESNTKNMFIKWYLYFYINDFG